MAGVAPTMMVMNIRAIMMTGRKKFASRFSSAASSMAPVARFSRVSPFGRTGTGCCRLRTLSGSYPWAASRSR